MGPGTDPRSIRCIVWIGAEMIRKAEPKDAEWVARILAVAMADDPVTTWILHGRDGRELRLRIMFEAVVRRAVSAAEHEVHICDDGSGAALWYGIGRWAIPTKDVVRLSPVMLRAGFVGVRAMRLNSVLRKAHPREAHYYLEVLGTVPERQGRGVGGALLSAVLDRCDADGVPAYLENSNPRNEAFYARHGFEPMPPLPLPGGCPPLVPMWRRPR